MQYGAKLSEGWINISQKRFTIHRNLATLIAIIINFLMLLIYSRDIDFYDEDVSLY